MTTNCNPALLPTDVQVTVHPLVLFAIVDHHTRRQQSEGRVIGTLLGRRDGNQVEITNCFAVPHAELGDEVAIGKDFNKQMLALHNTSKEVVVGWYASCTTPTTEDDAADNTTDKSTSINGSTTNNALVADTSSLIHDFYATETEDADPIHLVVDTRLIEDALLVKAYTSTPVVIGGEPMANLFHEVKVKMETTEAEAICLHEMYKTQTNETSEKQLVKTDNTTTTTTTTTTSLLQQSLTRLLSLLETTCNYVDGVVDGTASTTTSATLLESHGRDIADALSCVPRLYDFESSVLEQNLQDLLMVTYLSNITKTQLELAEKLTSTLGL